MDELMFAKKKPTHDPKFLDQIRALPCVVCGKPPPSTVSHLKTVGSGGGDDWFNVTSMCGSCHHVWEDSPPMEFCDEHPHFREYLFMLGWYFDIYRKLRHPELEKGYV